MIKRRKALATLATGFGAMISIPSWAIGWNKRNLKDFAILTAEDDLLLGAIVDTILPKTDTPGAKELGVPQLIQKIVKDCYDQPTQNKLSFGLVLTDAVAFSEYGNAFIHLAAAQRLDVLQKMSSSQYPDQKNFFNMIKRMTIDGYMSSEYVMTNITKYEMAPNRYLGCVPV